MIPTGTHKPLSSLEIEQQQAPVIQKFVQQASTLHSDHDPSSASALVSLIVEATSHPSLFAFSEILALPSLLQLQGTENSSYLDLLRLFAYGTWRGYKSNAGNLPQLIPGQVIKLKQLTVLTLAETNKVLSYDKLLQELEISNVRELEEFLIDHCINADIVSGKLNQLQRCLQVQFAAGRDLMDEQIGSMKETLSNWLNMSESLVPSIEEKIDWASKMFKLEKEHRKEINDKILKAARTAELMNADFGLGPLGLGFFGHGPHDHDVSDHDPHMINLFGQEFHYNEAGFDSRYKRGRSLRELRQRWGHW